MPVTREMGGVTTREAQWGELASSIDDFPKGFDFAPMLKGLPDDACQCPHWGYLIKGRLRVRYSGGQDETINAGDAFYMQPGHVPYVEEDAEWVLFSSPDKLQETREAVARNMAGRQ